MKPRETVAREDWADLTQGRFCRQNPYGGDEWPSLDRGRGDLSIPYSQLDDSRLEPDDSHCWFVSDYAGGSDYSGGTVHQSNHQVLVAECERLCEEYGIPADWYQVFHGGHGTYEIAFHIDRTPREVFDCMAQLENYPLIDEQDFSDLELKIESEAWESWGANDYRRAWAKHHGHVDQEFPSDVLDTVTEDKARLWASFAQAADARGWHCEHSSEGPWFGFDAGLLRHTSATELLESEEGS